MFENKSEQLYTISARIVKTLTQLEHTSRQIALQNRREIVQEEILVANIASHSFTLLQKLQPQHKRSSVFCRPQLRLWMLKAARDHSSHTDLLLGLIALLGGGGGVGKAIEAVSLLNAFEIGTTFTSGRLYIKLSVRMSGALLVNTLARMIYDTDGAGVAALVAQMSVQDAIKRTQNWFAGERICIVYDDASSRRILRALSMVVDRRCGSTVVFTTRSQRLAAMTRDRYLICKGRSRVLEMCVHTEMTREEYQALSRVRKEKFYKLTWPCGGIGVHECILGGCFKALQRDGYSLGWAVDACASVVEQVAEQKGMELRKGETHREVVIETSVHVLQLRSFRSKQVNSYGVAPCGDCLSVSEGYHQDGMI